MADYLQADSLAWALAHVLKFGDTDIFPQPFEYQALAHDWNTIGPLLQGVDFEGYRVHHDRRVMVNKPGGGFRAAIQLDPLDHLIYTAAIFECAEPIELARIPADKNIACSYRIKLSAGGSFFPPDNGWPNFSGQTKHLAQSGAFTHVLTADISDFYNQLGQHRIQNAVESAMGAPERSRNIEHFLNQITSKQSQGLPVGPAASIVLAEACLIDVDSFLLSRGATFTRYVDDFRIFCSSRKAAIDLKHELARYLFEVHRLSLESSKSKVRFVEKFVQEELSEPHELEEQARLEKLNLIILGIADESGPYWFEDIDAQGQKELLTQAGKESFIGLFEGCVKKPPLNLGLARHLLRKALRKRTNALVDLAVDNLENLAPALREVIRYLIVTIPKARAVEIGAKLLRFCRSSDVADLPFVRMWMLELLAHRADLMSAADALRLAEEADRYLGIRPAALIAKNYNQLDWVRARKETWRNNNSWDRRALIFSAGLLASGERVPFLSMVRDQGDEVDSALAKFLLIQEAPGKPKRQPASQAALPWAPD